MTTAGFALGNFDGVHRGHQVILKNLLQTCRKKKWRASVYTFDPHPAKILAPDNAPPLLQTVEQKIAVLKKLGVETVVIEKFDKALMKLSPRDFFEKILIGKLKAGGLWVGYDFTFGYHRSGNVETLKKLCAQSRIPLFVTPAQFEKAGLISSTQIRNLILQGKVDTAQTLIGRPFALTGKVMKGYGIGGDKLGIHTANLAVENELLPKKGIYITGTRILGARAGAKKNYWPSATSIGDNPTFPGKVFSVETHLIGFEGNLLGKKIEVEILSHLRDEFTFPTPESLADQIRKDIKEARTYHETLRNHR